MNQMLENEISDTKRMQKGLHIAAYGHIHQFHDDRRRWLVQSECDKKRYYMVTIERDFESCTCPDNQFGGHVCKHMYGICYRYVEGVSRKVNE